MMPLVFSKVVAAALLALGVAAHAGAASLSPVGTQFAPAGALLGDQSKPSVAVGPAGGLLVWEDNSVIATGRRIKAVRLNADLAQSGVPFVLSSAFKSKATGDQEKPRVVVLPDGSAVVVWQQAGVGKTAASQIFTRFISASGTPLKSDIRVAVSPKNSQKDPAVAALADGSVVVVWTAFELDGSMDGVFAQRFSAAGAKIGSPIKVNQHWNLNQRQADIAALSDGSFVIAWVSELQSTISSVEIYARHFDAFGQPLANEFRVSQSTSNACANPSVIGISSGGFAVAWSQRDDALNFLQASGVRSQNGFSTNGWDIVGRFYGSAGAHDGSQAVTEAIRFNATTYGDQFAPRLATIGSSVFAIWTSLGQDGSREGVFGRLIASNGSSESGDVQLNSSTLGPQFQPTVTSFGTDRYLAVWSSLTGSGGANISVNFDLFARAYLQSSGF